MPVIRGPQGFAGLAAIQMGVPSLVNPPYINAPDPVQLPSTVQSNSPSDPTQLLQTAKTNFLNAGYAGAECRTEKVYTPDGNFYTQNICSAPGYNGGDEANLVAAMTPAQLAAQRAYENANGAGSQQSYFQLTASAPNIQTSNYTGGSSPAPAPPTPSASSSGSQAAAPQPQPSQPASGGLMPANGSVTAAGSIMSSMSGIFDASVSIFGYSIPVWALGAGLLALPFVFGGKR